MKILGTAALALGILVVPAGFALAQDGTPTPGFSDIHQTIGNDMPRTHDKAAIVRELNNNGLPGQMSEGRSSSQDYGNSRG